MNDPHVVHLEYRIVCDPKRINWSSAAPAVFEADDFTVAVKDQRAVFRFRPQIHYGSENEAKAAVESYRRNWEFMAGLVRGPDAFTLRFVQSRIVDRAPMPSNPPVLEVSGALVVDITGTVNLTLCPVRYPEPPTPGTIARTPDIDSMHHRYLGWRAGKEPLPSMAYFCLTVLESMAEGRRAAAKKFGISSKVLEKVGTLCSGAGGTLARKGEGLKQPYTLDDENFLRVAIRCMILRAAEVAQNPDGERQQITINTIKSS